MYRRLLISTAVAAALLTGCVKEDAVCESGIELGFQYVLNPEGTDRFASEVGKVTVYVFDESETYLGMFTESGARLAQSNYRMRLPLPKGKYTALVWGGSLDTYLIGEKQNAGAMPLSDLRKGITRLEDFRIALDTDPAARAPQTDPKAAVPANLYYGKKSVEVVGRRLQRIGAELIKNTSKLQFRITELPGNNDPLPEDISEVPYLLSGSGANTTLAHDNAIVGDAPQYQYAPSGFDAGEGPVYNLYMGMPRLTVGNPVEIKLWSEKDQTFLIDDNLLAMIFRNDQYNTQTDLDREDLFLFEIVVDRRVDLSVRVFINGFEIISIEPDI